LQGSDEQGVRLLFFARIIFMNKGVSDDYHHEQGVRLLFFARIIFMNKGVSDEQGVKH
jgi:hypothetical protein